MAYLKWYSLQVLLMVLLYMLLGYWAVTEMSNALAASIASIMVLGHAYAIRRIQLSSIGARSWERCLLLVLPTLFLLLTMVVGVEWMMGTQKPLT